MMLCWMTILMQFLSHYHVIFSPGKKELEIIQTESEIVALVMATFYTWPISNMAVINRKALNTDV